MGNEIYGAGDQPQATDTERTLMVRELLALSALQPPDSGDLADTYDLLGVLTAVNTAGTPNYWQIRGRVQGVALWILSPVTGIDDSILLTVGIGPTAEYQARWGAAASFNDAWSAWSVTQTVNV